MVVGLKQSLRAMEAGQVEKIAIAGDAEETVLSRIRELAGAQNIPVEQAESMAQLGRLCGIQVGAAVAAFLKEQTVNRVETRR
ncbi:MAG TPA: 50S ribosomal protein L7ae-like protein [Clostridiales bacterium]|nr:50S ribosomal protein L7ae-like protein [Clostridiales bacterium]